VRFALVLVLIAACGESDVSRSVGARCDKTSECDDRCLGPSGEYPGGFCTVDCSSDGDCPGASACVERDGGVCLFTCSTDEGCRFLGTGWTCHDDAQKSDPNKTVKVCRG
jgi:hypothetical protein